MMTKLKFRVAPLLMAGAAAGWLVSAPYAVADTYAAASSASITHYLPEDPGGSGCANGTCGSGGPQGGGGCTANGTCGSGGPQGGSGCTASGACGGGGPQGGQGCVPGVGCFNYGS